MKNNILIFLLGVFVTISIAATVPNGILTIKPVTPKYVLVKPFWGMYSIQENMTKYVIDNVKKGYIVKTLTLDSEENGYQRGIVVMEKY